MASPQAPAFDTEVIETFADLTAFRAEWAGLLTRSQSQNPFAGPWWAEAWAHHFIPERDLRVIAIRGPELVAVFPFYEEHRAGGYITVLRLMGTGHHVRFLELPQALIRQGYERKVYRHLVGFLFAHSNVRFDWCELVLPPEHGWFEPQWIPEPARERGAIAVQKSSRACVVMSIPNDRDAMSRSLKRNVRNSISRSRHRLERAGEWRVARPSDMASRADLRAVLDTVVELHEQRHVQGTRKHHSSYFDDDQSRRFFYEIAETLVPQGLMRPSLLVLNDAPIAALVALRAGETTYFSLTGMDVAMWELGAVTALLAAELEDAADSGVKYANFSPGPDVAKLRWSETLQVHNEFVFTSDSRRARLAFGVGWPLQAVAEMKREKKRLPAK